MIDECVREYSSKNADWSTLMDKVITYNPFYYLEWAKDYSSNNWRENLSIN